MYIVMGGLSGRLQAQNVHNTRFKVVSGASSIFFLKRDESGQGQTRRKEEACNTFVLPTITSMCTYNVSGVKAIGWYGNGFRV
jgi:hypothetical protein